ncbi:MAG: tetratricopeptide repeat protein [Acidobacteria bacterium]|nr:tetratricopeptide repeat protein [Acidobacteriota bacterium]
MDRSSSPFLFLALPRILLFSLSTLTVPLYLQAQDCLEEGKDHLKEGRLAQALATLDRCKEANAEHAGAYFYSGIALAAGGNPVEALVELEQAVELDPEEAEYALALADALSGLGQWTAAVEVLGVFEEQAKVDQLEGEQLWLLSDIYFRSEQFDQALGLLDWMEANTAEDPRVDFRRAQIHMSTSNLEEALRFFEKSAQNMPGKAPPHFGAGVVLRLQNQPEAAKRALLQALQLEPSNPEFLWQLAEVCLTLNEPDQALRYLTPIENSDSTPPEIYRLLGESYRRLGDPEKSRTYLNRFQELSLALQEEETRNQEAQSLIARGEEKLAENAVDEAKGLFEQTLQKTPDNWLAHSYLAKIYLSSGFLQFAYRHLSRMEELDPEALEGNYLLASYWYRRGDFQQAQRYAEKTKARYPGSGSLRNLFGNIYMALRQPDKAIQEYAAAVRLNPERSDFRSNYESLLKNRQ